MAAVPTTPEVYGRRLLAADAPPQHAVQFYEDEAQLIDVVAAHFESALARGEACVGIATAPHRTALLGRIGVHERLILLDADATLAMFITDGRPDRERFRATVAPVIRDAAARGSAVRAFGEMVDRLCRVGRRDSALELERLWNDLAGELSFTLVCGYALDSFRSDADRAAFEDVCASHSHVVPAAGVELALEDDAHIRQISLLQQRTRALETEIAERRRVEEDLRRALRVRDDFISLASHELRTPLAILHLQAQSLQRAPGDIVEKTGRIARTAHRITSLIDQLFDVARLDHERLELERRDVDLDVITRDVVGHFEEELERFECPLTLTSESVVGSWDPIRVGLVVSNLLANAIKYGRRAPIEIAVSSDGSHGVLSVRDHGIGIAAEDHGRIFQRFERAAPSENYGGLGLGLWITRAIVEQHGGMIAVESAPGEGALFTVRLPC